MSRTTTITDYPGAVAYLKTLKARGVSLGLQRMSDFAAALDDPHRQIPCIHIAGTNGKGSVAAMVEAILRAAGWKTGLYTSPHLVRLGERIQVNRTSLAESEMVAYVEELLPLAEAEGAGGNAGRRPSYFEFMTAMAFRHFSRRHCDIAVIEVGMGGRLDATNIVTPEVSVITSIGFDHCDVLGDTLDAIAAEKAGIIKAGRPVVIGRLPDAAERVVRAKAREMGARVDSVREQFGELLTEYPETNLAGWYQRGNAATATLAARTLSPKWRISPEAIETGLHSTYWPGRWQKCAVSGRVLIMDSAHNAEGATALEENLAQLVAETGRRPIMVVGVLGESRAGALLEVASRHAAELHLVVPAQARACSFEQLHALVPASFRGAVHHSSLMALFSAQGDCAVGTVGDVVVVTGSIYLVGEVLAQVNRGCGPNEGDLQDF